uniref:Uncharacterized protein n=1 Tax=Anguilla anguilla TaxID=7936 RepID=A0A0E9PHN6_ANGAN
MIFLRVSCLCLHCPAVSVFG